MRSIFLFILFFATFACKTKRLSNEQIVRDIHNSVDSCLLTLPIDTTSLESKTLMRFWTEAKRLGYSLADDTISPFVKVIFKPASARFYVDTLKLVDCTIFNDVNIHRLDIQGSKSIDKKYYANLTIEEWEFKDIMSAMTFVRYYGEYIKKDYPIKSPINIIQKDKSAFLVQTAAYKFIHEMETMERLIDKELKIFGKNY